jgi:hypothetical protein
MKPQMNQGLAAAYAVKRNAPKRMAQGGCPACMDAGGKCYAHGGETTETHESEMSASEVGGHSQYEHDGSAVHGTAQESARDTIHRNAPTMKAHKMQSEAGMQDGKYDYESDGPREDRGEPKSRNLSMPQPQKYARGGEVENEKLNPNHEEPLAPGIQEDLDAMDEEDDQSDMDKFNRGGSVSDGFDAMKDRENVQSNDAKFYVDGGVVDDIMKERKEKRMASGGLTDTGVEDDFDQRIDMEPVRNREDEEHDTESGSLDDESLVGQIMRDRRKRRGM